jgi:hypothetical protein
VLLLGFRAGMLIGATGAARQVTSVYEYRGGRGLLPGGPATDEDTCPQDVS